MDVVAEGVETLSQLSQLRKLNCLYGQGYLFSRPVDAETVTTLLSKKPHWQADLFPTLMNEPYVPVKPVAAPMMQLLEASA
jgi:predicted signal transduction protein with EAL and GGDEF domain